MKKLTIITATYNSGETLERYLKSVVSQLNDSCELIIIDGGSSDNTVEIISNYSQYLSYWISEPDKGVYDAWNKAITVSKGEWITFIGSDDELCPGAITKYFEFINSSNQNEDLICGKINLIRKSGLPPKIIGEPWNWERLKYRKWSLAHPGMLHHRNLFKKNGMYDINYKICGDVEFLVRIGPDIKASFIDFCFVNMYQGGLSGTYKSIYEGYKARCGVLNPIVNNLILLRFTCRYILRILRSKVLSIIHTE